MSLPFTCAQIQQFDVKICWFIFNILSFSIGGLICDKHLSLERDFARSPRRKFAAVLAVKPTGIPERLTASVARMSEAKSGFDIVALNPRIPLRSMRTAYS
jgi:hypothetical protein